MVDRFGSSAVASELERSAKAGLLAAPESAEEVARLRSFARVALERAGPGHAWIGWFLFAVGLAEYRAGDFDAAIEKLERCLGPTTGATLSVPALAIQAMALARGGKRRDARERLERAERLFGQQIPTMAASDWGDRLVARRLVREAQAVVRFDPDFPANPIASPPNGLTQGRQDAARKTVEN
jgi:hypothetical protein